MKEHRLEIEIDPDEINRQIQEDEKNRGIVNDGYQPEITNYNINKPDITTPKEKENRGSEVVIGDPDYGIVRRVSKSGK